VKAAFALLGLLGAMGAAFAQTAGETVREYPLSGFTRVRTAFGIDLDVVQASAFAVALTADPGLMEKIVVEKRGNTLWIGMRWGLPTFRLLGGHRPRAAVSLPVLEAVEASGGSAVTVSAASAKDVEITLSGGARVTGSLKADAVRVGATGGGGAELAGGSRRLDLRGSGGAWFRLFAMQADEARVEISGGAWAEVAPARLLSVRASGGSHVTYRGSPRMDRQDLSGGAWVRQE
jgi:hypothetical protein